MSHIQLCTHRRSEERRNQLEKVVKRFSVKNQTDEAIVKKFSVDTKTEENTSYITSSGLPKTQQPCSGRVIPGKYSFQKSRFYNFLLTSGRILLMNSFPFQKKGCLKTLLISSADSFVKPWLFIAEHQICFNLQISDENGSQQYQEGIAQMFHRESGSD